MEDESDLTGVGTEKMIEEIERRGEGDLIVDFSVADALADAIAERRTDDALDLLRQLAPTVMHPSTIKRLVADRAAEGLKGMLS